MKILVNVALLTVIVLCINTIYPMSNDLFSFDIDVFFLFFFFLLFFSQTVVNTPKKWY